MQALQSPFGRALPPVPEDFLGRARDVWAVLQHLSARRAVVVCGAHGEDHQEPFTQHGIGKSAVLDAVHRAFALHMGGVCVAVQMRALSEADSVISTGGWIEKLLAAVRLALEEVQHQWWPSSGASGGPRQPPTTLPFPRARGAGGALLRRRAVRPSSSSSGAARPGVVPAGFHPLTDPIALRPAIEELVSEMGVLSGMCEARQREWPAASGQVLLLLDECDHLIQQQHFQEAVADILQRCAAYRVVLSTHQPMVGFAGGHFKVVHQSISGLVPEDAARLFLRRVQRPLRWNELVPARGPDDDGALADAEVHAARAAAATRAGAGADPRCPVMMNKANEADVLRLVGSHPSVAVLRGNPRRLIELASRVGPQLRNLGELAPRRLEHPAPRDDQPAGA